MSTQLKTIIDQNLTTIKQAFNHELKATSLYAQTTKTIIDQAYLDNEGDYDKTSQAILETLQANKAWPTDDKTKKKVNYNTIKKENYLAAFFNKVQSRISQLKKELLQEELEEQAEGKEKERHDKATRLFSDFVKLFPTLEEAELTLKSLMTAAKKASKTSAKAKK